EFGRGDTAAPTLGALARQVHVLDHLDGCGAHLQHFPTALAGAPDQRAATGRAVGERMHHLLCRGTPPPRIPLRAALPGTRRALGPLLRLQPGHPPRRSPTEAPFQLPHPRLQRRDRRGLARDHSQQFLARGRLQIHHRSTVTDSTLPPPPAPPARLVPPSLNSYRKCRLVASRSLAAVEYEPLALRARIVFRGQVEGI